MSRPRGSFAASLLALLALAAPACRSGAPAGLRLAEAAEASAAQAGAAGVTWVRGLQFDEESLSPAFPADVAAPPVVLKDCYVLLFDGKLARAADLVPLLKKVAPTGKPLFVIAEEVEGDAAALLAALTRRGSLRCYAARASGDGGRRRATLRDIAAFAGGRPIDAEAPDGLGKLDPAQLGRAGKVVIERDTTTLVGGAGDREALARASASEAEAGAAPEAKTAAEGDADPSGAPVSYFREVLPILRANCVGCHCPAKKEGKLLLTTHKAFRVGGKHGAGFVPGDPRKSHVMKMIAGEKPQMPKNADPLKPDEVTLIARWIRQGAPNDSPPPKPAPTKADPPVYAAPPAISALAWSPDGKLLAVSGYHEVLLHEIDGPAAGNAPGSSLVARLVGASPRVQSIAFSTDGKLLAVAGGMPTEFGEIQIWDPVSGALLKSFKVTADTLYGVSFSPDGGRVAFGCADKTARILAVADGQERMRLDNHSDWVMGAAFTLDGKRLVSSGRDRAMKLTDVETGQFIDDINKLLEPVLCMARHPKENQIAYGGAMGTPRVYKISDNQGRTAANNDSNLVREFERQPGPVQAVAYGADGSVIAVGGVGPEVRLYAVKDGARLATLPGHGGAVFAIAFHPDGKRVATGGFDGRVRLFDISSGRLLTSFVPVPIQEVAKGP